jgi:hypothetical protein
LAHFELGLMPAAVQVLPEVLAVVEEPGLVKRLVVVQVPPEVLVAEWAFLEEHLADQS